MATSSSEKSSDSVDSTVLDISEEDGTSGSKERPPSVGKLLNVTQGILEYNTAIARPPEILAEIQEQEKANFSTFVGVFLPVCQNVFGVITFLRLPWLIGVAGAFEGFLMVGSCCLISLITAISLSAISTNWPPGSAYDNISRCMGTSFGGAAGILFYIGSVDVAAT